jgi:hypothetical protein
MSVSNMFLVFSWAAIAASMLWAIAQLFTSPPRSSRVSVPILIAVISALALYTGVLSRDQQSRELANLEARSLAQSQRIPCGGGNPAPPQVTTEAEPRRGAGC